MPDLHAHEARTIDVSLALQALVVVMTAMHMENTHLLVYDPCTMRGW